MANLKIDNLNVSDREMHRLGNISKLKINDLPAISSEMHELADDEVVNIVGGVGGVKACPPNPKEPITP
jgi:hypothetical protein